MTAGEAYCNCTLVRVVGDMPQAPERGPLPFCAGILVDPNTQRAVFAAPLLWHLVGATADQLRHHFARYGWRATIVRRKA